MTSTIPLVLVVSFWLLIYIRRHYVLSSVQRPLLPVALSVHPRRSTHALWTLRDYAEVDLTSPFILRGKTSLFVDSHASLLEILGGTSTESTTPSLRRLTKPTRFYGWDLGSIVKIFYNLGSVTTVVGQILGLGVLWWSLLQLGLHLQGSSDLSSSLTHNMAKRSPVVVNQPLNPSPNQFLLRPLIPGFNLPMSHLLPIFFSLMVCTTIHELGHAIAAAADGVSLLSWGYSLILAIPAAFVELAPPLSTNRERTPPVRLRIISAGVYHNLITLLVLSLVPIISSDRIIWLVLGYRDIGSGVVVVDVDMASPLRSYLIPGSIITRINDVGLSKTSNDTPQDLWSSLLLMRTVEHDQGWCVGRHWFEGHSQGCCPPFSSPNNHEIGSCFVPQTSTLMHSGGGWCLDPVPLFENQTKQRCLSHRDCNTSHKQGDINSNFDMVIEEKRQAQMCITPHSSAELLRISFFKNAGDSEQKVIVWKGPKREVWEQVTIGKYVPRLRILPLVLPGVMELLVEYLRTVSLSLFFFNLLPIRFLDGGEIFSAFLQLILAISFPWESQGMALRRRDTDIEMEAREWNNQINQRSIWRRRAQKIESVTEIMAMVLIGVVSIGGLFISGVG